MTSIETGYAGEVDASWKIPLVLPETAWRRSIGSEPNHPPVRREAVCEDCHYAYNAHLTRCPECAA